jgi:type I restriction enzyme S subunit
MEHIEPHTMRLLGTSPAASMKSSANRFYPGDVLYGRLRPYLNKVWRADFDGICSAEFIVLPRTQGLIPDFVRYRLHAHDFVRFASHLDAGDRPRVDFDQIGVFDIALPDEAKQAQVVAYLDEQLSRLDASVAALHRVQVNLKRYRASVLKAACEGRLVPTEGALARQEGRDFETGEQLLQDILRERQRNWSLKRTYEPPGSPGKIDSSSLPAGWTWATVGQLLSERLCNGLSIKGSDAPPGIRALKLDAMTSEGFDFERVRYLPVDEATVSDILVRAGDYFVSRGNGSLNFVGRGTLAQDPSHPVIFPDTMIRLRFAPEIRRSQWIRSIWESRWVRRQIEVKVKTTAGIYKISQPELESVVVPLPPLAEQYRIVAEVDRRQSLIRVAEAQVTANLARAQRLRQSILQSAFSVPQTSSTHDLAGRNWP